MEWKELFEPSILQGAKAYIEKNQVSDVTDDGKKITGLITGANDIMVSVTYEDEEIKEMTCSCAMSATGRKCKHMAAVMYVWNSMQNNSGKDNKSVAAAAVSEIVEDEKASIISKQQEEIEKLKRELAAAGKGKDTNEEVPELSEASEPTVKEESIKTESVKEEGENNPGKPSDSDNNAIMPAPNYDDYAGEHSIARKPSTEYVSEENLLTQVREASAKHKAQDKPKKKSKVKVIILIILIILMLLFGLLVGGGIVGYKMYRNYANTEAAYAQADAYISQKLYMSAIESLENVADSDRKKGYIDACEANYAISLYEKGAYADSLRALENIDVVGNTKISSDTYYYVMLEDYYNLGKNQYEQGNYGAAIEYYDLALDAASNTSRGDNKKEQIRTNIYDSKYQYVLTHIKDCSDSSSVAGKYFSELKSIGYNNVNDAILYGYGWEITYVGVNTSSGIVQNRITFKKSATPIKLCFNIKQSSKYGTSINVEEYLDGTLKETRQVSLENGLQNGKFEIKANNNEVGKHKMVLKDLNGVVLVEHEYRISK